MDAKSSISCIKGVGPKTCDMLNKCGIYSVMDLLLYFPRDYEIIKNASIVNGKIDARKIMIECEFIKITPDIRTKNGKVITTLIFSDSGNLVKCRWFNQPYMKNRFAAGKKYRLLGKIENYNGENILMNPTVVKTSDETLDEKDRILPVYPLKGELTNNLISKLISSIFDNIEIEDDFPEYLVKKYDLCSLDFAVRNIHRPESVNSLEVAKVRLKFQELFTYSLNVSLLKNYINKSNTGISFSISPELKLLKDKLPFKLTEAQSRVIKEVLKDEKNSSPMNRLVQGDVGSGKTIVAFIAMFNVVKNGYQAVMMAPTEILAVQHYNEAKSLFGDFNINIELLVGSISDKNKEQIKAKLKSGSIDILIGTHALFEDDVIFDKIGIVVTDEQHRFGVMQRCKLFNKGKNVDVLVMTATPIPRTLTLCLYGDLDVSIIDELPPGRIKIKTKYIDKAMKDKAYKFALNEINKGRQVYIVCPLVEENDELDVTSAIGLFNSLNDKYFKQVKTAVLYGKMPPKEKESIMSAFKSGDIKVLVSTTVIEVGINVPNATLMIIENAERFGLAQLHQLRGRVGRGSFESHCILIADVKNDIIRRRMEIICSSNDGFFIAEEDLKLRGSGEIFGHRQHGEDGLILSDIVEDIGMLKAANYEAKRLLKDNSDDSNKVRSEIMKKIEQNSRFIAFN